MLVDPHHPFFRPLWIRILSVVLPLAWAFFELSTGAIFWAILFGAAGIYLLVALFVIRKDES
ncbi:hypothetical protein [Paracoccus lutimaris]|uniref:DUF3329 domain-containing protein n=1 Tax=Paracoccus lutimaris TaxID=1490030 RepID=A0A368Z594_9RHOB|nr:hypothetical protein [Paracoccus lutimaris]RCW87149.1 hypothetical protein DFP89_103153 [Paracoccus lutimaris]